MIMMMIDSPVTFAYEQALLSMGFHPDIWYEAALFLESHSKQMMERGVSNIFHG